MGELRALESLKRSAAAENPLHPESGGETRLDLDTAPLILGDIPKLRDRIRQDLKAICSHVTVSMPGAGVLLAGSLSAGEGRPCEGPQPPSLESDYDLIILTPSLADAIPLLADRKLAPLWARRSFSAAQEITLAWKPLLALGVTTTAGRLIGGAPQLAALLIDLPAPRPAGALEGAYRCLAAVPLAPEKYFPAPQQGARQGCPGVASQTIFKGASQGLGGAVER